MKYAVQVNYRTHRGNASSRTFVVEASSEPEAVEIANGKAKKHPNVQSIVGGDVVEVFSPAPTDWIKEFANIQSLRDKAIQYIVSATPADGIFVSDFYVQVGENFIEVRHIGIDKDGHITLNDKEIEPIASDNVPDSDWVLLAGAVQEAIAGGTKV